MAEEFYLAIFGALLVEFPRRDFLGHRRRGAASRSVFQSPLTPAGIDQPGTGLDRAKRDPGPSANEGGNGFGNALLSSPSAAPPRKTTGHVERRGGRGRIGPVGREGGGIREAKPDGTPGISR